MASDLVLVHFNPRLPIVLSTDASQNAVAGVLSHIFENGDMKPIAFVSRALRTSERNYSTIEKEALAIIFSVTKLRQYLLGIHFELQTDHKPLESIFGENKGLPVMAAARIQRWAFILSGFDYSIKHIKGVNNISADCLSRMPQTSSFVVARLREIFCRFGLVEVVVSDNGSQFTSDEFKTFLAKNMIKHSLTAPGHPASNNQAENFVKTLKKSIYANLNDSKPDSFDMIINRFLADYRTTKHSSTNETPAKLLLGRELKTRFSLLKPPCTVDVLKKSQERKY